MNKRLNAAVVTILLLFPAESPLAIENVDINGFFSVGATKSNSSIDSENGNISDEIGFEQDTRVGLQVSAEINPHMSVTAQILGDNRRSGGFDAEFDWAFVSYAFNDNASLRGGKIKFPTFLISDYFEVGYAYPWIRPPSEVYSSNPINAISGVDALLRLNLGAADLLIQPYFGVAKGDEALLPQEVVTAPTGSGGLGSPVGTVVYAGFEAENMAGVNVALSGDFYTLRAGYLQTEVSSGAANQEDVSFISAGATMDWNNVIVYSEYFEREIDGLANVAFPNQKGWYGTLGYRFDRFLPHVTFAQLRDNSSSDDLGMGLEQDSVTLGVRYEIGAGAALKVEAQRVEPETGNRGQFMEPTDEVDIYSIAVDVIF